MGQWLNARIHEHRCDLSPSGNHLVYFACRGGRCWTALSKAPWLTAVAYWPQSDSWMGGGAFTADGKLWLNGASVPENLPDGLKAADVGAFPHSTDGFHMGDLVVSRLESRGWYVANGERYQVDLRRDVSPELSLSQTFLLGQKNRALISGRYVIVSSGGQKVVDCPAWEWADCWGDDLQWAENGSLWQARLGHTGRLENRRLIHEFSSMQFEAIKAPYPGVSTGVQS